MLPNTNIIIATTISDYLQLAHHLLLSHVSPSPINNPAPIHSALSQQDLLPPLWHIHCIDIPTRFNTKPRSGPPPLDFFLSLDLFSLDILTRVKLKSGFCAENLEVDFSVGVVRRDM